MILQPTHPEELEPAPRDQYDPTSESYGQWLTTGEFTRSSGPARADIRAVTDWLHGQGLSDTRVNSFAVEATGASPRSSTGARRLVLELLPRRRNDRIRGVGRAAGSAAVGEQHHGDRRPLGHPPLRDHLVLPHTRPRARWRGGTARRRVACEPRALPAACRRRVRTPVPSSGRPIRWAASTASTACSPPV